MGNLAIDNWLKTLFFICLCATSVALAQEPGDEFKDCHDCPTMIVVPPGTFIMGSPDDQDNHRPDEVPQHAVLIPTAFAMGKYEVTFEQWGLCVSDGGCNGYQPEDDGWGRGTRPAMHISFEDAQVFLSWLSAKTGKTYRFPSESEWEYAARAGASTTYNWGNEVGINQANCASCGSQWDAEKTAPVGSFEANTFKLHGTAGNVSEWVQDCWHERYTDAPSDGSAWEEADGGDCGVRVVRGGSWDYLPRRVRSATRFRRLPGDRLNTLGFRLAQDL